MILQRPSAIVLHTILKQIGKPSFFGKDKILEKFWGYTFVGYFPPSIILRARYLYEAGVFGWWQKHAEYSLILKTNIYVNQILPKTFNQTNTRVQSGSKTAVIILTLIPGVGLLISLVVFIGGETASRKAVQKRVFAALTNCLNTAKLQLQVIRRFGFKSDVQVENVIIVNVQPQT